MCLCGRCLARRWMNPAIPIAVQRTAILAASSSNTRSSSRHSTCFRRRVSIAWHLVAPARLHRQERVPIWANLAEWIPRRTAGITTMNSSLSAADFSFLFLLQDDSSLSFFLCWVWSAEDQPGGIYILLLLLLFPFGHGLPSPPPPPSPMCYWSVIQPSDRTLPPSFTHTTTATTIIIVDL